MAAMSSLHQLVLRASRHQLRRMCSSLAGVGNERLAEQDGLDPAPALRRLEHG
jgi:hypothetical protein